MFTLPSPEAVRDACIKFDDENSLIEESLEELFRQFPHNRDRRHVFLKVAQLNTLYSTQIYLYSEKLPNVFDMAEHIYQHGSEIETKLNAGLPEVVDLIGNLEVPQKHHRNYFSFAAKYCSWHKPNEYPIWDSNVERYLMEWRKQTGLAMDFDINGHWKYPALHEVIKGLRQHYGLDAFSYKQIDKFLFETGRAL